MEMSGLLVQTAAAAPPEQVRGSSRHTGRQSANEAVVKPSPIQALQVGPGF